MTLRQKLKDDGICDKCIKIMVGRKIEILKKGKKQIWVMVLPLVGMSWFLLDNLWYAVAVSISAPISLFLSNKRLNRKIRQEASK